MRATWILTWASLLLAGTLAPSSAPAQEPVALVFDTDLGNDIDDALALGVIHALESRGAARLLAVTLSKGSPLAGPAVDAINHFYGRPTIPVGVSPRAPTPEPGKYLPHLVEAVDPGGLRFPRRLEPGQGPDAVQLLRKTLAAAPDRSVVIVVVGFSSNLAALLETPGDSYSTLPGRALVAEKVRSLSMMAGMFSAEGRHREYNVFMDLPAAQAVLRSWPTPIVVSGFEIGTAVKYPAESIEQDFGYVPHHPLPEAYALYQPMPYDRECWDLTSVLQAVWPERGYFGISQPGTITVDEQQLTQFTPDPQGLHRYLTISPEQVVRVREALVQLASQPPARVEGAR